ncbi:MAG TPA: substrate-binding domain-containing protein [Tepidisphaeraceae bacterium]|jgi:LacI family transcriptional regulator
MRKSLHILLGIPADLEFGRGVIQGVIRYAATTNWVLSNAELDGHGTLHEGTSRWLQEERGGIIALVESARQASFFKSLAVPCVSVSSALDDPELPSVACDDKMIGGIAASHFLERRMRNFAYVGMSGRMDSEARFAGFSERLAVDGFNKIESYEAPVTFDSAGFQSLSQWIDSLSKPVGIFAMNDLLGRSVIDACRSASIRVPANVAVLGCGNDPIICGLSTPSLSSVALPAERVGFDAAEMLTALLTQKKLVDRRRQINVSSVIPRGSTDNVSVRDPDVASALRFILAHAGEWIGVRELLLALPVQRRSLERKFRRVLGRSPLEEIRRVRVDLAKQLLSSTDLPMPIIARRSGFSEAKQLSQVFRSLVGMTPTSYRARFRLPEPESADGSAAEEAEQKNA